MEAGMPQTVQRVYAFGPFRFDGHLLVREGTPLHLTPKTASLLLKLLDNHGRVVTKKELFKRVWPGVHVSDGALTFQIRLLRKALGHGVDGQRYVETIPRIGYRFVERIHEVSPAQVSGAASTELPKVVAPVVEQDGTDGRLANS